MECSTELVPSYGSFFDKLARGIWNEINSALRLIFEMTPTTADDPQLSLHRADGTAQLCRDFFIRIAFELPLRHTLEITIRQECQKPAILFGQLGGEFGSWLAVQDFFDPAFGRVLICGVNPCRFAAHPAVASLLSPFVDCQVA